MGLTSWEEMSAWPPLISEPSHFVPQQLGDPDPHLSNLLGSQREYCSHRKYNMNRNCRKQAIYLQHIYPVSGSLRREHGDRAGQGRPPTLRGREATFVVPLGKILFSLFIEVSTEFSTNQPSSLQHLCEDRPLPQYPPCPSRGNTAV